MKRIITILATVAICLTSVTTSAQERPRTTEELREWFNKLNPEEQLEYYGFDVHKDDDGKYHIHSDLLLPGMVPGAIGTKEKPGPLQKLKPLASVGFNGGAYDFDQSQFARIPLLKEVEHLDFSGTELSGEGVKYVAQVKGLQSLMTGLGTTDEDMKVIAGIKTLTYLDLQTANVTSEGIALIAQLENLEYLNLSHQGVKVGDLAVATKLPKLAMLEIEGTELTDEHLSSLSGCKKLKAMNLNFNAVTGTVFANVELPALERILLYQNPVTDETVGSFAKLPKLRKIAIHGIKVPATLAGLMSLAKAPLLTEVAMGRSKQDPQLLANVKAAAPNLVVKWVGE